MTSLSVVGSGLTLPPTGAAIVLALVGAWLIFVAWMLRQNRVRGDAMHQEHLDYMDTLR